MDVPSIIGLRTCFGADIRSLSQEVSESIIACHKPTVVRATIRDRTANIDSLRNMFRSTQGNGVIHTDLSDCVGSFGSIIELSRFRNFEEDFLVDSVVN